MKLFIKTILYMAGILLGLYALALLLLYANQESIIFHPKKLGKNYRFNYTTRFKELSMDAKDGKRLSALLFEADTSKGLVFYLHGNSGALDTWGDLSELYTANNYDFFIMDYRGFGKSEGEITSEEQFYQDVQLAYNQMKKQYGEDRIIVIGYSIGTGPAAMLAAKNHPRRLILKAPYYNLTDLMHQRFSFVPDFVLSYKFATNAFLPQATMPVTIFHGTADGVISYSSSLKLKELFKKGDTLITLPLQKHNGMNDNAIYRQEIRKILED